MNLYEGIKDNLNESKSSKMNSIKYETKGYNEAKDGIYKGENLVNYREKDFKKGTSVLTPFVCYDCGKEYYVKSSVHDFFKQGDFDDPYETPDSLEGLSCPKCKSSNTNIDGYSFIKEPGEAYNGELNTRDLRKFREDNLDNVRHSGSYKIKIMTSSGETEWLNVSENEFDEIRDILI